VHGAALNGWSSTGSGAFFGELALRSNQPRAATVKASGFSTTGAKRGARYKWWQMCDGVCSCVPAVLQLPQEDFNWLMAQKGDIKELIEQQANSYARSGMGPYDDKDGEMQPCFCWCRPCGSGY
jgi:hypothetical protein